MRDKGRVTVFLCLIVSAMTLLGITAIKLVSQYCAAAKTAMASRTALSDIKASYDGYIFEHYHILLFDKNGYGSGEAAIEERLKKLTQDNLGSGFEVSDVELTDFTMIYDDNFSALKNQIEEQLGYVTVSYGIDEIVEKLGGTTTSRSDALENEVSKAGRMSDAKEGNASETGAEDTEKTTKKTSQDKSGQASDPRDYTSANAKEGVLLSVLLPADREVSSEDKLPSDMFSGATSLVSGLSGVNTDFDSYDDLKEDIAKDNTWGNSLDTKAKLLMYVASVFNCFTEKDINSESVLVCELEYIIAGKRTDYDNLDAVCRKIIAIRFPVDMAYLVSDTEKMNVIKTLSAPLALALPFVTEPVVRYLIAGGWAYVEAMAETRNLLAGNRLEFAKSKENWITDLSDIGGSVEKTQNSDRGLGYKDYLMILLAMEDNIYYRMLDVMDINARQENSGFRMSNAAVGLAADFDISYGGTDVSVHQASSYSR
jgi:hypothetical protein